MRDTARKLLCLVWTHLFLLLRTLLPWVLFIGGAALTERLCRFLWPSRTPERLTAVLQMRSTVEIVVPLAYAATSVLEAFAPKPPDKREDGGLDDPRRASSRTPAQLCTWLSPIVVGTMWGMAVVVAFWLGERLVASAWQPDRVPDSVRAILAIRDITVVAVSFGRSLYGALRIMGSSVDLRRLWRLTHIARRRPPRACAGRHAAAKEQT